MLFLNVSIKHALKVCKITYFTLGKFLCRSVSAILFIAFDSYDCQ